eukprot:g42247.t1
MSADVLSESPDNVILTNETVESEQTQMKKEKDRDPVNGEDDFALENGQETNESKEKNETTQEKQAVVKEGFALVKQGEEWSERFLMIHGKQLTVLPSTEPGGDVPAVVDLTSDELKMEYQIDLKVREQKGRYVLKLRNLLVSVSSSMELLKWEQAVKHALGEDAALPLKFPEAKPDRKEEVLFWGWVRVQDMRGKWVSVYVELDRRGINQYNSPTDENAQKGLIQLGPKASWSKHAKSKDKMGFSFHVMPMEGEAGVVISASSESERQHWLDALKKSQAKKKSPSKSVRQSVKMQTLTGTIGAGLARTPPPTKIGQAHSPPPNRQLALKTGESDTPDASHASNPVSVVESSTLENAAIPEETEAPDDLVSRPMSHVKRAKVSTSRRRPTKRKTEFNVAPLSEQKAEVILETDNRLSEQIVEAFYQGWVEIKKQASDWCKVWAVLVFEKAELRWFDKEEFWSTSEPKDTFHFKKDLKIDQKVDKELKVLRLSSNSGEKHSVLVRAPASEAKEWVAMLVNCSKGKREATDDTPRGSKAGSEPGSKTASPAVSPRVSASQRVFASPRFSDRTSDRTPKRKRDSSSSSSHSTPSTPRFRVSFFKKGDKDKDSKTPMRGSVLNNKMKVLKGKKHNVILPLLTNQDTDADGVFKMEMVERKAAGVFGGFKKLWCVLQLNCITFYKIPHHQAKHEWHKHKPDPPAIFITKDLEVSVDEHKKKKSVTSTLSITEGKGGDKIKVKFVTSGEMYHWYEAIQNCKAFMTKHADWDWTAPRVSDLTGLEVVDLSPRSTEMKANVAKDDRPADEGKARIKDESKARTKQDVAGQDQESKDKEGKVDGEKAEVKEEATERNEDAQHRQKGNIKEEATGELTVSGELTGPSEASDFKEAMAEKGKQEIAEAKEEAGNVKEATAEKGKQETSEVKEETEDQSEESNIKQVAAGEGELTKQTTEVTQSSGEAASEGTTIDSKEIEYTEEASKQSNRSNVKQMAAGEGEPTAQTTEVTQANDEEAIEGTTEREEIEDTKEASNQEGEGDKETGQKSDEGEKRPQEEAGEADVKDQEEGTRTENGASNGRKDHADVVANGSYANHPDDDQNKTSSGTYENTDGLHSSDSQCVDLQAAQAPSGVQQTDKNPEETSGSTDVREGTKVQSHAEKVGEAAETSVS